MPIPKSFIETLRMSCDIVGIVSSYVKLKRTGRNQTGLCPFHSEKTPSMVVYGDTQSFYCFGCGAGGDVISFIMRIENLGYVEAVKFLAQRVGLEVPDNGVEDRAAKLKPMILEMNRLAARAGLLFRPAAGAADCRQIWAGLCAGQLERPAGSSSEQGFFL